MLQALLSKQYNAVTIQLLDDDRSWGSVATCRNVVLHNGFAKNSHIVQDIHKQLEKTISEFHHTEDTILYPSCFDANAGLFEALLTAEDAIISDALNHASIIDGIRLCKV